LWHDKLTASVLAAQISMLNDDEVKSVYMMSPYALKHPVSLHVKNIRCIALLHHDGHDACHNQAAAKSEIAESSAEELRRLHSSCSRMHARMHD
jgi:hypothetical protein